EGSTMDTQIYEDAQKTDLIIPAGKYLLANAGFPFQCELLILYCGVCYHLAEWGRTYLR
ncbi:hypothetical protein BV22DRAFT_1025045, partial [Leucogyrophana mollusca]